MEFIRKHAKTILALVALIFIAGLFYMNYASKGPIAVKVNGTNITYEEFQRTFARNLDSARDSSKDPLTADDIKNIKQRVLATMVQDELIIQEATKLKITVSDDAVAAAIMTMKAFQQEGVFNTNLYRKVLAVYYRMPRYEFEESIRRSLKRQFLRDIILSSSKASPMELEMEFKSRFPDEKYAEKKDEFKNDLINEKRSLIYYGWMNQLINNAKIINNLPKLEKDSG